jgi:hypothetical protein
MSARSVFAVDRGIFDHPMFEPEPFTEREAWLWLLMCGPVKRTRRQYRILQTKWRWKSERRVRAALERFSNAGLISITDEYFTAFELENLRTASWRALRQAVFERDGFACVYCGSVERLACDHIVARSRGGRNELSNLAAACQSCNSSKRDRPLALWRPQ